MHCDLDLSPFNPKVNSAHPWLMGGVPVKLNEDRCKGEAVMHMKPFYQTMHLQADGQMDGQGDSGIPPPPISLPPTYLSNSVEIIKAIMSKTLLIRQIDEQSDDNRVLLSSGCYIHILTWVCNGFAWTSSINVWKSCPPIWLPHCPSWSVITDIIITILK